MTEDEAYQIRDAIAAVTRMFVAIDRTYMEVPHFIMVGGLGCGRSHWEMAP